MRRMANSNPIPDNSCKFCCAGPDSIEHFYYNCNKIKDFYNAVDLGVGFTAEETRKYAIGAIPEITDFYKIIIANNAIHRLHHQIRKNGANVTPENMVDALYAWAKKLAKPPPKKAKPKKRPPIIKHMPSLPRFQTIYMLNEYWVVTSGDLEKVHLLHPSGITKTIDWDQIPDQNKNPLHAYTDGSFKNSEDGPSATWAYSILGTSSLICDHAGHVSHNHDDPLFIADCADSNNTGELSALYHILTNSTKYKKKKKLTIWVDSTYAIAIAKGIWKPKANYKIAAAVRAAFRHASSKRVIDIRHQYSHVGFLFNDRADQAADAAHEMNNAAFAPPRNIPLTHTDSRNYYIDPLYINLPEEDAPHIGLQI